MQSSGKRDELGQVSRTAASIERYFKKIQQFINLANLLPCEMRDGEWRIDISGAVASLRDSLEHQIRVLGSKRARSLREELSIKSNWWTETELARAIEHMPENAGGRNKSSPDLNQMLFTELIGDVADRFRRRFPSGVQVGEDVWGGELGGEWDSGDVLSGSEANVFRCYVATRVTLTQIVDQFSDWKPGRFKAIVLDLGAPMQIPVIANYDANSDKPTLTLARDPVRDGLLASLVGIDARRIKRCPVCGNFLIASRSDKIACTGPCTVTERQRRQRDPVKRKQYERNRQQRLAAAEYKPQPKGEAPPK